MKRILSVLIAMTVILSCSINASALIKDEFVDEEVVLRYQYATNVLSSISISSKTATCKSTVVGQSGVATKIVITQYLQKKSGSDWNNVQSWTKTFNQASAIYTNKKSSLSSGTYRTRTVAKVYSGNNYETIKQNSSTATC